MKKNATANVTSSSIYRQSTDSIKDKENANRGIVYGGVQCHTQEVTFPKKPIQILIAIIDKHCPSCGASRRFGFDLGISRGKIFGGICFSCGWSF